MLTGVNLILQRRSFTYVNCVSNMQGSSQIYKWDAIIYIYTQYVIRQWKND